MTLIFLDQQPTRFRLVTHTIEEVFTTPSLISSVTAVSELRLSSIQPSRLSDEQRDREREPPNALLRSVLLLQVFAAADYYSSNTSLMQNVPPVHVDISESIYSFSYSTTSSRLNITVLDPFILNVLPESLVPTVIYILALFIASWLLSAIVHSRLRNICTPSATTSKKET